MKNILVVSSNSEAYTTIEKELSKQYKVSVIGDSKTCFQRFRKKRYEALLIDVELFTALPPEQRYHAYRNEFLALWEISPDTQIIVLASQQHIKEAVRAVKAGANTYLSYPIRSAELKYAIGGTYESTRMHMEIDHLRDHCQDFLDIAQSNSPAMQTVLKKIQAVAPTQTTVLLTGETGTGKGVIAKLLHSNSQRNNRQFIRVHCGAIPDSLIESELFGHEKGSFTGATQRKLGKFEIANGGTIFLDEIGTINPATQIKMLQVLQDKIVQRIGSSKDIEIDVRIIAATNASLEKMVAQKTFRKDLYYRLSVFPIEIPPLRERAEDIPILAKFFLEQLNAVYHKKIEGLHSEVLKTLKNYSWPGNIRELKNLIERAYILESSSILTPKSFPSDLFGNHSTSNPLLSLDMTLSLAEVREQALKNVEKQYLRELLSLYKGKINDAAQAARISSRQLRKLLARYQIRKEEFKTCASDSQTGKCSSDLS